jgi:hypothetical protein
VRQFPGTDQLDDLIHISGNQKRTVLFKMMMNAEEGDEKQSKEYSKNNMMGELAVVRSGNRVLQFLTSVMIL